MPLARNNKNTGCDVLIAGGGVAGTLVASMLTRLGYQCILVEPRALAAEQSGHSHGYIHRGYIYLRAERGLVQQLRTAREQWEDYISGPGEVVAYSDFSFIGFDNPLIAKYASQMWRVADLPVVSVKPSEWPSLMQAAPLTSVYRTDEQAFDFPRVVANVLVRAKNCRLVQGSVAKLQLEGRSCTGVQLLVGSEKLEIEAKHVVLAAGIGTAAIIARTLGRFRSVPSVRTSYMLVIRGRALRQLSLILPENQFYGLFMVSRPLGDETVWLVSNYLSYSGCSDEWGVPARTWVRATLRTLEGLFPVLRDPDLRWGIYAAPKAEFRADPEYMPEGGVIETLGLTNVTAVWPTKLTLAPIITRLIVDQIASKCRPSSGDISAEPHLDTQVLQIAPERWTTTTLLDKKDFERQLNLHINKTPASTSLNLFTLSP